MMVSLWDPNHTSDSSIPRIGQAKAEKPRRSLPASLTRRASASREVIESGSDPPILERNRLTVQSIKPEKTKILEIGTLRDNG